MIPLSFAQRRLWFVNRLEGASATYNVPTVLRFGAGVDVDALVSAVGDVVERHEVLRTVFGELDGEPFQRVMDPVEGAPVVERGVCSAAEVDVLVGEFSRSVFDLSVDAPVRVRLWVTDAGETVLVVLVHHIATDGWSEGVLLEDLRAAYEARVEGGAPVWEPLPVQYADYALWQRDLFGDAEDPESLLTGHLRFWRSALEGVPEVSSLPLDRARPGEPSGVGGVVRFDLDARTHERVLATARRSGCTLLMVVQAAVAVALSKAGGGEDVVLGTPVAGREEEDLEGLVGFFVNSLVLRTRVDQEGSFTDLLTGVREADLEAFGHQEMPFDLLVEELNPA
ncbi:condensation domain-containing protein, partial [Nocardiopsis alkaliphila]|uniref:condensation domain-containing protein n=1 Tax=Nocardiopsis alkaliphila TaxID=225762 RepID=UPI0005251B6B